MPLNTTASLLVLAARRFLPEKPRACEVFHQSLEVSDQFLRWLIGLKPTTPFLKDDLLSELLTLNRADRWDRVPSFYEALGFDSWMAIDSEARPGHKQMDFNLSLQRDYGYTETFDFVSNNGSTEHVFDQRAAFENIHQLCRVGGIMLHKIPTLTVLNIALFGVPPVFLHDLAMANGYEVLDLRVGNRWGDTVHAVLDESLPAINDDFKPLLPARPGFARGCALEGPGDDEFVPLDQTPPELRHEKLMGLAEMLQKSALAVPETGKLSEIMHVLTERAKCFRPNNPGELYSMALFRKVRDEPFRLPFQSKFFEGLSAASVDQRYRKQFEAWAAWSAQQQTHAKAPPSKAAIPSFAIEEGPQTSVTAVTPHRCPSDKVLCFSLEAPAVGHSTKEYSLDIAGWVVGSAKPITRIEVHAGSTKLRTTDLWLPSPEAGKKIAELTAVQDWKQRLRDWWTGRSPEKLREEAKTCGFHASVSVLGLPEKFKLRILAFSADGTKSDLGEIRGRRQALRTHRRPRLQPLILTGPGSSGGNFVSELLALHPGMLTHLHPPQSSRVAVHAMRCFQVQTIPGNPQRTLREDDTEMVGPIALHCRTEDAVGQSWLRKELVERLALQTQENIEAFYTNQSLVQRKTTARYFVERAWHAPLIGQFFHELYPDGREIFVVRDFRTMATRGVRSKENRRTKAALSPEALIKRTACHSKQLLEQWRARRGRAHLLRFEDLLEQPQEALEKMFAYLGLEIDASVQAEMLKRINLLSLRAARMSEEDPHNSLSPEMLRLCERECAEALEEFGYSVNR